MFPWTKIENKLDKIDGRLNEYNLQLQIHIESHKALKEYVSVEVQKMDLRIDPLEKAKAKQAGEKTGIAITAKAITWLLATLAAVAGVAAYLK